MDASEIKCYIVNVVIDNVLKTISIFSEKENKDS
jgi:hypothetical protein